MRILDDDQIIEDFVKGNFECIIGDFGIANTIYSNERINHVSVAGNLMFMVPEILLAEND